MKYDLDYIKSLYVLYEETDPDDEDSFYTVDYTIGEHFDDTVIRSGTFDCVRMTKSQGV